MSQLVDISAISIFQENKNITANRAALSNGMACFAKEIKRIPLMVAEISALDAKTPKLDRRTDVAIDMQRIKTPIHAGAGTVD